MGYDLKRFHGDVDDELICCICREVLQDPVQADQCEHAFCIKCINGWLSEHQNCPVDRTTLRQSDLKPPSRILRNIHKKLVIKCDNLEFGCTTTVKLELLQSHLSDCPYNPKRPVACSQGCGVEVPLDEMQRHHCLQHLRSSMMSHISTLERRLEAAQAEIEQLKEYRSFTMISNDNQPGPSNVTAVMPTPNYGVSSIAAPPVAGDQSIPNNPHNLSDEEIRWCQSLDEGRVRRWGGMISTPDNVLQGHIRRSLQESGCPTRLLNELMNCAHERQWPPCLNSLEMRQVNRVCYEQYVTRRVPGKQAVVVLYMENQHMDRAFVRSPGMVLIFAHGID